MNTIQHLQMKIFLIEDILQRAFLDDELVATEK